MSGVLETIPIKQLLMVTEMAAEKCKPGKSSRWHADHFDGR